MDNTLSPISKVRLSSAAQRAVSDLGGQQEAMTQRVRLLSEINSGTVNQDGVDEVAQMVEPWLSEIADSVNRVPLPPHHDVSLDGSTREIAVADVLIAVRRPMAKRRVLLNIHLDTVFGPDHAFQNVRQPEPGVLHGPGVADAKGGLIVMLAALEAFERSYPHRELGWEVVLNTDEETGSRSSIGLLREAAARSDLGLVFEPTLPDGTLIHSRKGSGNFAVVIRGRAAHAGREFARGRNAVHALSQLFITLEKLNDLGRGVTLNLGRFTGGGPSNIVPDLAIGWFNVRVLDETGVKQIRYEIDRAVASINERDGFSAQLHGGFTSPPKPLDAPTKKLFDRVFDAGRALGLTMRSAESGGVCDGNKLAAAGLPTIDTLGPQGGHIHSDREYLLLDSLVERARLTAVLLHRLAEHPDTFPTRHGG
ncbi:MAG: hydrolase [Planctomycetota bacterium]